MPKATTDNGGWLKLWYKTRTSVAMSCGDSLAIWTYLLLHAAPRRGYLPDGRKLERGSLVTGQRRIAEDLEIGRKRVARWLDIFEAEGMIKQEKGNHRGTIVHIINFGDYQARGKKRDHRRTTGDTAPDTNSKRNKKNKRDKSSPPNSLEIIESYAADANLPDYAEQFYDYYRHSHWVKSNGEPVTDWQQTYRQWCDRQKRFNGGKEEPPVLTPEQHKRQRQQAVAQQLARREQVKAEQAAFKNDGDSMADMLKQLTQTSGAT